MTPSQQLDAELWLASRLKEHGIFEGTTTTAERKERFRLAMIPYAEVIAGARTGKPERYRETFERIYGESLVPPREVRAKGRAVDATPGLPAAAK